MQIIQFQCDKCKRVWDSRDKEKPQEVNISVRLNYGSNQPPDGYVYGTSVSHQTWCRTCIEEFVKFPDLAKQEPAARQLSEIDMLVEMLERLGFNRQQ